MRASASRRSSSRRCCTRIIIRRATRHRASTSRSWRGWRAGCTRPGGTWRPRRLVPRSIRDSSSSGDAAHLAHLHTLNQHAIVTSPADSTNGVEQPQLTRRFGLLPATALNMTNMIGVGPFITIPLLMTALGGPQAIVGWLVALVIVICDGMVWSELGAAMPGSGGSFNYLREAFGKERYGRLMAFLFVWQFVLSGPLEIASGYIGFAD